MTDKEIIDFAEKGQLFEAKILKAQEHVRTVTANKLSKKLINCRIIIASLFSELIMIREKVPGNVNENNGQILHLLVTYIQGFGITEDLIFIGQYSKAASVLKHEYEILTRIKEFKNNCAREGKTPNVKFAPTGSQKLYSILNDISHPSRPNIISELLKKYSSSNFEGVSPLPFYVDNYSDKFYKYHLYISFEILKENILLMIDLYGDEILLELEGKDFFKYFLLLGEMLINEDVIKLNKNNA